MPIQSGSTGDLLSAKKPVSTKSPSLDIPVPITNEQGTFIFETLLRPALFTLEKSWVSFATQDGPAGALSRQLGLTGAPDDLGISQRDGQGGRWRVTVLGLCGGR